MKKQIISLFSTLILSSCALVATDPYGNESVDIFEDGYSDEVSIEEKGTVKVINNNTIKACGFSSLDTARQEAYALALDTQSTQDITGSSRLSCQKGSWNDGCVQELNSYSVMTDKKVVNTVKEGDCYLFSFKHVGDLKQVQSFEAYASFNRTNSIDGESLLQINFVNVNSSVRVKMNGKDMFINKDDKFEIKGPKDVTVEVIDSRFNYKSFTIKVPKAPKLITKNVSLVQMRRKAAFRQEIGAGFEKQDYKIKFWFGPDKRSMILFNRHDFDAQNDRLTNLHSGIGFFISYDNVTVSQLDKMIHGLADGLSVDIHDNFTTDKHFIRQDNLTGEDAEKMTLQLTFYGENVEKLLTVNLCYRIIRVGNRIHARYNFFSPFMGLRYARFYNSYSIFNKIDAISPFRLKNIPDTYDAIRFDTGVYMNVSKVEARVFQGWESL